MTKPRVALVSMPWGSITEPSLGLGLLKGVLREAGVACDVIDAPLDMLRHLRFDTYEWARNLWAANEFCFSEPLQGRESPEQVELLDRILTDPQGCVAFEYMASQDPEASRAKLLTLRNDIVPTFLDTLLEEHDFSRYTLVGFTCLFDQTLASLALARRLRERHPELLLAFGGYALQKPVGPALQRAFPEMDVVAYGDGEATIVPLVRAASGALPLSEVPNITWRDADGHVHDSDRTERIDLDTSPVPDYHDYFRARERLREVHLVDVAVSEIPVESSRGCWWGQRSHCTFCGIDEETLRYRKKHPDTIRRQLDELHARHGHASFRFSDYIIPPSHFTDLFPGLESDGAPYRLHTETKANLTEAQIAAAARAGVTCLQPGIESLDSRVLRLMDKGVSGIQNVFTIHAMMRHGIVCAYNLLFGHPGETEDDYHRLLALVPSLSHFQPPASGIPIQWTRFAPLLEDAARFGADDPRPRPHWRYDVLLDRACRERIGLTTTAPFAYYFESPYAEPGPSLSALRTALQHQIVRWTAGFHQDSFRLSTAVTASGFTLTDTRFDPGGEQLAFSAVHERVRGALDGAIRTEAQVLEALAAAGVGARRARSALEDLVDARVVHREGQRLTWLAFDESFYAGGGAFSRLTDVARETLGQEQGGLATASA